MRVPRSRAIGRQRPSALFVGPARGPAAVHLRSGALPTRQPARFVEGDIEVQTRRVLENIKAHCSGSARLTLDHIVRTTVFLADMDDFAAMNAAYRSYFTEPFPARSTVQAARLPRNARLEIDAIASYDA
jgi:2-iminobutanoate/2-iminopropanoate deaminase